MGKDDCGFKLYPDILYNPETPSPLANQVKNPQFTSPSFAPLLSSGRRPHQRKSLGLTHRSERSAAPVSPNTAQAAAEPAFPWDRFRQQQRSCGSGPLSTHITPELMAPLIKASEIITLGLIFPFYCLLHVQVMISCLNISKANT